MTKERWEAVADPPPGQKREKWFVWLPAGTRMEDVALFGVEDAVAADSSRPIWWVEGEECVRALRARNEIAVCGPGGSGQRIFGRALDPLAGRTVVIWPDNDDPGRKHLHVVRDGLERVGANARVFQPAGLPVGGDAADFFTAGRTLDEFSLVAKPQVSVRPEGTEVVIPTDTFPVSFTFTPYGRARGEVEVELAVRLARPFPKPPYEVRLNLLSQSAIRDLRLGLEATFGKDTVPKWAEVISWAISLFRQETREQQRATVESVRATDEIVRPEFVCGPHVVEGGGTFLFGPPGAGKSTTAMLMGVSIDAGISTLWPVKRRRVLWVNLERPAEQCRYLYSRCLGALGLDRDQHELKMLNARGHTLADVMDTIRESIWRDGVELLIVDSLTRAGYGDLIDNQAANRAADALNSFGVTWVCLAHTPRGDDTHIYGSVMFDAAADVMVNLVGEEDTNGPKRGIQLTVTKTNYGKRPKPEVWAYTYSEDGLVDVCEAAQGQFSELDTRRQVKRVDRIAEWLLANGESDAGTIAEDLGLQRNHVSEALNTSPRFVRTRKDGKRQLYGVAADAPSVPTVPPFVSRDTKRDTREVSQTLPYRVGHKDTSGSDSKTGAEPAIDNEDGTHGQAPSNTPSVPVEDDSITCSRCHRERMRLAGFNPSTESPEPLPLCPACADEVLGGVA
ncbi:MAG: AAA family ATPase [Dehalococcoidia bacterium]